MTVVTIVLGAVAGFMAFWAGVVSLIGMMGWRPLAQRYPADRWPEGEGVALSWQSARIGMSNYNGVLRAVVTVEGLYLRPVRLFAFNHPPLFVPWGAVEGRRRGLLGGLRLRLEGGASLTLGGRLAKMVAEVLEAAGTPSKSPDALGLDAGAPPARLVRGRS